MKSVLLSVVFLFLYECKNPELRIGFEGKEMPDCRLSLEVGRVYGDYGKKDDVDGILINLRFLVSDICSGHLNHLGEMVPDDLGLFVDAKGHWSKAEVIKDLANEEGYFATYFFNQKLLDKQKGTEGNLTIQRVLKSSYGILVDFYFDSALETEIQLRFRENPKNARYLINPIFVKAEGKWKLLRMF